jgi:hypothetical protein
MERARKCRMNPSEVLLLDKSKKALTYLQNTRLIQASFITTDEYPAEDGPRLPWTYSVECTGARTLCCISLFATRYLQPLAGKFQGWASLLLVILLVFGWKSALAQSSAGSLNCGAPQTQRLQSAEFNSVQQWLESGSGPGGRRLKSSLPDQSFSNR